MVEDYDEYPPHARQIQSTSQPPRRKSCAFVVVKGDHFNAVTDGSVMPWKMEIKN